MIFEIIIPSIFFVYIYINSGQDTVEEIEEGRRYEGDVID